MTKHEVKIKLAGEPLTFATDGAAAMDLRSRETVSLPPGQWEVVRTGVHLEMPDGVAAYVLPRSGLALRWGVTVLNAPGLIDSDYRGEVGVILMNHGTFELVVNPGDRIAQLLFTEYLVPSLLHVNQLTPTDRGADGFGSTGTN